MWQSIQIFFKYTLFLFYFKAEHKYGNRTDEQAVIDACVSMLWKNNKSMKNAWFHTLPKNTGAQQWNYAHCKMYLNRILFFSAFIYLIFSLQSWDNESIAHVLGVKRHEYVGTM